MKQYLLIMVITFLFSCSSYNNKMNGLLKNKKIVETAIDSNHARDQRFRQITGYNEINDSLSIGTVYPHPELVDSIYYLKTENEYLKNALKEIEYSIDSLQKLK